MRLVKTAFKYVKRMLPLFRALVKIYYIIYFLQAHFSQVCARRLKLLLMRAVCVYICTVFLWFLMEVYVLPSVDYTHRHGWMNTVIQLYLTVCFSSKGIHCHQRFMVPSHCSDCLTDWQIARLIDGLIDWLIDWLDWLVARFSLWERHHFSWA